MFRFSIRELMLVTLVVAMGVGWWLDHRCIAAREKHWRREAVDLAEQLQNSGESAVITFPGGTRSITLIP